MESGEGGFEPCDTVVQHPHPSVSFHHPAHGYQPPRQGRPHKVQRVGVSAYYADAPDYQRTGGPAFYADAPVYQGTRPGYLLPPHSGGGAHHQAVRAVVYPGPAPVQAADLEVYHYGPGPPPSDLEVHHYRPGPPPADIGVCHYSPGPPPADIGVRHYSPGPPPADIGVCNYGPGPSPADIGVRHYSPGPPPTEPTNTYIDERWTHLRQVQEATRRQLENDEETRSSLSARQLQQFAATYSRSTARQLYIQRKDGGFGFTLRHFIVYPPEEGETGGPPISDPLDTIFVKSIKEGGPAVLAGLNIGDRIVKVNGESVAGRSYAQVVQMIQKSRNMLRLEVVPKQDDILQVYFSEIAENPETNKRLETGAPAAKPLCPASVCSSSSRESSPFSSKTSDSTRDAQGRDGRQSDMRSLFHRAQPRPVGQHQNSDWENLYETIGGDRLKVPSVSHSVSSGSTEHVYAVPALARSSVSSSTLGSGATSPPNRSRDSLDSDSSLMAGFNNKQDDPLINKIKKDCERKEEFMKNQTYPAYLSSPPKDIDASPYGIASLANTMPPPKEEKKEPEPPPAPAFKNFFMDIYAKEVSKMQSVSKSSAPTKKRNFDATQFNTYGLPLGYRRGGAFNDADNFSRNNFVIIGSRSLHCEPPQMSQPAPEPQPPVCDLCYEYPVYYPGYCPVCPPPCQDCAIMTMTTPYHPRPPRPNTLPGLQTLQSCRGRHDSPNYAPIPPSLTTHVHMHPDPQNITQNTVSPATVGHKHTTTLDRDRRSVIYRRNKLSRDDEEERNLRRVSYLQATKDERMDTDQNLVNETGIAPTHGIKKIKSIFGDKSVGEPGVLISPPSLESIPVPPSPKEKEPPKASSIDKSGSETTLCEGIKEGYLTCKVAILDGKRANDRSWKTVYAVLKSKALYMFKDKKMAMENLEYEEKPVALAESEVEVANDYTKRKNVFRVKTDQGSEYLFQAENELMMKDWVRTIDVTVAVIIDERKKLKKLTSFRNRSPTGQSPSSKTRKPSADPVPPLKDKKNWKGKVVKQLKRMGGGGHGPLYPEGGSIGVPLDECPLCPDYPENEIIPYLVKVCCDIVNEKGLEIVGIYRVPGNNAAVTYLTEQINKGVQAFGLDDHRWNDVNVVSSLLKSFFRKLPDPLFTVEMYSMFIEASKVEQPAKRLDQLRRLVRDLPEVHLETLRYLTQHLCNVADHSSINKMEIRNLAIVFGPTLVRTTDDNMVSMVTDMSQQCRIIESLLAYWDYFFTDSEEVEVKEEVCEDNILTGSGNQSVMLMNLQKLENAGKLSSPKGDVSTKDIVSSIISAANRKMLRTGNKAKKESTSELEERSHSRQEDQHSDSRRESESVIHGALQIASALPGLVGSLSTSSVPCFRSEGSPFSCSADESRSSYGRRESRGSLPQDLLSRRGSLPHTQSSRASLGLESSEARIAVLKADSEHVVNGLGENQEVIRGKLSLVSVVSTQQLDSEPSHSQYKFPIETYTGLDVATAERIKKFEAETKAMLSRSNPDQQARLSLDGQIHKMRDLQLTGSESSLSTHGSSTQALSSMTPPTQARTSMTAPTQTMTSGTPPTQARRSVTPPTQALTSVSMPTQALTSLTPPTQVLRSVTTPIPDSNPLHGGILLEEPYLTTAYDRFPCKEAYLSSYSAASIPSLMDACADVPPEILAAFDTNKIAKRGTLQRLKIRNCGFQRRDGGEPLEEVSDAEDQDQDADSLLGELSASFDQKMRFLLDPDYQGREEDLPSGSASDPNLRELGNGTKKELDDVKNSLLREKANKKVELKRSPRVDRNLEPEIRRSMIKHDSQEREPQGAREPQGPGAWWEPQGARELRNETVSEKEPVLKQVNNRKPLKRSDSLTKKEKTEINRKKKEVEKENKVMKLKEHFEQTVHRPKNSAMNPPQHWTKFDVIKVRKKLSDSRNRRIKRRHTVGGTKDFTENILSKINQEKSKSSWDRLAPLISNQELISERNERWNLGREDRDERRLSLPDCGVVDRPIESHV